jgi:hypothetical protein
MAVNGICRRKGCWSHQERKSLVLFEPSGKNHWNMTQHSSVRARYNKSSPGVLHCAKGWQSRSLWTIRTWRRLTGYPPHVFRCLTWKFERSCVWGTEQPPPFGNKPHENQSVWRPYANNPTTISQFCWESVSMLQTLAKAYKLAKS